MKLYNKEDIKTVIFAGGEGSRLSELTCKTPKPMVEIGGYPLIWHIMKVYSYYGFNKFILTLGYKKDYIINFITNTPHGIQMFKDFEITLVDTGDSDTPQGERLHKCQHYLKESIFMCANGDTLMNINIDAQLKQHLNNGFIATTAITKVPHSYGIIESNSKGELISYNKGHLMNETINTGFLILNKEYFNYLKPEMAIEDPFEVLAKDKKMGAYYTDAYIHTVETLKDYRKASEAWIKNPTWKVWKS